MIKSLSKSFLLASLLVVSLGSTMAKTNPKAMPVETEFFKEVLMEMDRQGLGYGVIAVSLITEGNTPAVEILRLNYDGNVETSIVKSVKDLKNLQNMLESTKGVVTYSEVAGIFAQKSLEPVKIVGVPGQFRVVTIPANCTQDCDLGVYIIDRKTRQVSPAEVQEDGWLGGQAK